MAWQIICLFSTTAKKVGLQRTLEYYKAEKLIKEWEKNQPNFRWETTKRK